MPTATRCAVPAINESNRSSSLACFLECGGLTPLWFLGIGDNGQ
jgi:hypothetical protein